MSKKDRIRELELRVSNLEHDLREVYAFLKATPEDQTKTMAGWKAMDEAMDRLLGRYSKPSFLEKMCEAQAEKKTDQTGGDPAYKDDNITFRVMNPLKLE